MSHPTRYRHFKAALALLLCLAALTLFPQAPGAAPYPPVTSLTVNTFPTEIGAGQWTPIQVIVLNYENFEWTRDNVYIRVLRDDARLIDGGRLDLPAGVIIRPARQRTVTGKLIVPAGLAPGAYPLELQLARSNGQVMGVKFTTTVNVPASGLVQAQGLKMDPPVLAPRDRTTARFTITNAGAAPTAAQTLQLYASPDQAFWSTRDLSRFGWQMAADAGAGPSGRWGAAMAFDTRRGRMLLFGGNANGLLGDTWEYLSPERSGDQPGWKALGIAGPSAREGAAMAYDNSRGRIVLFGGAGAQGPLGDTWEYASPGGWTRVTTPAAPSPRGYAQMVYDPGRRRMILFGGNGATPQGDMWEYVSGAGWSPIAIANGPSARYSHGMAFDFKRGRIILYGGRGFGRVGDMWQYTPAAGWTQLADPPFNAREGHAMVYDHRRDRIVLFGGHDVDDYRGETWSWNDGQGWRQVMALGPNTRANFAAAYDPARGKMMVVGGWDSYYVADSWELLCGGDDMILGEAQLAPLAPGQRQTLEVKLDLSATPAPLSPGNYWVGLVPDAYGITRGQAGASDWFLFPAPLNLVKSNPVGDWMLFE